MNFTKYTQTLFRKSNILKIVISFTLLILLRNQYNIDSQVVVVQGDSMFPALSSGQIINFSKKIDDIQRYDIVLFRKEQDLYIKRILGVPGDLYLKNAKDPSSYQLVNTKYNIPKNLNYLQYKVIPKNFYFLVGDNTGNSFDSRSFGLVHINDIVGKI